MAAVRLYDWFSHWWTPAPRRFPMFGALLKEMQGEVCDRCDSPTLRALAATSRAWRARIRQHRPYLERTRLPWVYVHALRQCRDPCAVSLSKGAFLIYRWARAFDQLGVLYRCNVIPDALLTDGHAIHWTCGVVILALTLRIYEGIIYDDQWHVIVRSGCPCNGHSFECLTDVLAWNPMVTGILLGDIPNDTPIVCPCKLVNG